MPPCRERRENGMKFCPNCGAQCEDSEKFCHHCGTRLEQPQVFNPRRRDDTSDRGETADPYSTSDRGKTADPYGTPDRGETADPYGTSDPYDTSDPYGNPGDTSNRYESPDSKNTAYQEDTSLGGMNGADGYYGGPMPSIRPRNIVLSIFLSIITCGIYRYYWMYKLNDETREMTNHREDTSGGLVVLFSIITCGIYELYWLYRMGCRIDELQGKEHGNTGLIYVMAPIAGSVISGILYSITDETYSGVGAGLILVAYGLMQDAINKALQRH